MSPFVYYNDDPLWTGHTIKNNKTLKINDMQSLLPLMACRNSKTSLCGASHTPSIKWVLVIFLLAIFVALVSRNPIFCACVAEWCRSLGSDALL